MTDLEAVERRISRRSYLETPLEPFTSGALLTLVSLIELDRGGGRVAVPAGAPAAVEALSGSPSVRVAFGA